MAAEFLLCTGYPHAIRVLDALLRYRPDAEEVGYPAHLARRLRRVGPAPQRPPGADEATVHIARGIAVLERDGIGPTGSVSHAVIRAMQPFRGT